MNKTVERAYELAEKEGWTPNFPDLEIGDICTIADVWDGEGAVPEESYSYVVVTSDYNGVGADIVYVWEVIKESDDFCTTEVKITDIYFA